MRLNAAVIIFLFCIFISKLASAETGYEVELIIFEDTQSRYQESEDWSFNDMLNNTVDDEKVVATDPDPEFNELEWTDSKLAQSLDRIKSNSNYNILINKRWKQTGLDRNKAYAIELTSLPVEENNEDQSEIDKTDRMDEIDLESESIVVPDSYSNQEAAIVINTDSYIQGRIKLIMSRYLHFEVKLNYYQWQEDIDSPGFITYPVVAERRMRSREIHYLDHPMIGIIVLATPYKIEEPLTEGENSESAAIGN